MIEQELERTNGELNHSTTGNQDFEENAKRAIELAVLIYSRLKVLIRKYFLLILLILVAGVAIGIYKVLNKDTSYKASLVFILQEDLSTTSSASVDPLTSYFLASSASQTISLEKLVEIVYSQRVITNLLFNKCIIRGQEDYLINHILKIYYGHEQPYYSNFSGLNGLNRNQYRVFSSVVRLIRNSASITQTKSGAFSISLEMKNEELTKVTTELLYQNVSNFYIDKTTERAQTNYIFLRNRLDSVRNMLYSSEYQVANFEDRAKNLLLHTARVPQNRQIRNTEFYQSLYGELIKSFEKSKVTLNNITPVFQLLSRPYYPLYVITKSSIVILLIWGVVASLVVLLLLAGLYLKHYVWPEYRHLFRSNTEEIEE